MTLLDTLQDCEYRENREYCVLQTTLLKSIASSSSKRAGCGNKNRHKRDEDD
jgi:hypothetical protein